MKASQLSDKELEALRAAHRGCRDKRSVCRLNAVILVGCGWMPEEVADALLIDENMLRSYVERYRRGGVDKLLQDNYSRKLRRVAQNQLFNRSCAAHYSDEP